MPTVSERLKELRLNHKLTQKNIADFLGITESGYGYYEQGRNEPSIGILKKLSEKYSVSIDYLTGQTDNPDSINNDFDPMAEINHLLKKYDIDQSGFFDIEKWKAMGPDEIRELESYFEFITSRAQQKKEQNEE